MKRLLKVLLATMMAVTLVACGGGSDNKAEVVNGETGEVELLSPQDLMDICDENQARFDKYYLHSPITFVDKVESVDLRVSRNGGNSCDEIIFESGWILQLKQGKYDLSSIVKGDTYQVESEVWTCSFCALVRSYDNTTFKKVD